jgi:hypothetical protein
MSFASRAKLDARYRCAEHVGRHGRDSRLEISDQNDDLAKVQFKQRKYHSRAQTIHSPVQATSGNTVRNTLLILVVK